MVFFPGVGTVPVASFGQRFAARLIDGVITVLAIAVIVGAGVAALIASSHDTVDAWGATSREPTAGGIAMLLLSIAFAFVLGVLYEWLFIAYRGATPGKMAMSIVVVDEVSAQPIGLGRSLLRVLFPALANWVLPIAALVIYLSPLFDGTGRLKGWHDQLAKDFVVQRAGLPAR
ncbi:hypothetical protein A5727_09485 [Mycobacterium sp. ACS4331]|nr:hypothetical protein A5727_09485 [Mycobacterium sp. ACS4331]